LNRDSSELSLPKARITDVSHQSLVPLSPFWHALGRKLSIYSWFFHLCLTSESWSAIRPESQTLLCFVLSLFVLSGFLAFNVAMYQWLTNM
jgi:hypothetical protein